ncbi:HTH-like domain-containing protein [Acinetobacter baumannii]|uniref:HTH-like domain-containing protein n=1 Tax=Acinetobacter baumannii TaxID=470 RepID=UPI003AF60380
MSEQNIYERIRLAMNEAPRNRQTADLHLQMIKYADDLKNITSKEFCEGVGLPLSYGNEFSKMRNITERLKAAGLKVNMI